MSISTTTADPSAPSVVPPELKKARIAVSAAFAIQAMLLLTVMQSLTTLMPLLGLSASKTALIVLALSAFAAVGSVLITLVANKTSSALGIRIAMVLILVASFGLAFSPAVPGGARKPVFLVCMVFYGLAVGALDATSNMQAVAIQRRYGRIILNSFHASWSAGAFVGIGIAALGQTIGRALGYGEVDGNDPYLYDRYMWTMVVIIALLFIIVSLIWPKVLKYSHEEDVVTSEEEKSFKPPMKIFAAICAAMVFFYFVDFCVETWGSVFLANDFDAMKDTADMAAGLYMAFGLIARLLADKLARRFGESKTLMVAAIISVVGMIIVVSSQSLPVALVGFAIAGCGVPITAPLCFSTVGYLVPMKQVDVAIGRLNLFNYIGTLLGGGVIGLIAHVDLRIAMGVALAMCVLLVIVAPFFRHPNSATGSQPVKPAPVAGVSA